MFRFLKEKIKSAITKISGGVEKEEKAGEKTAGRAEEIPIKPVKEEAKAQISKSVVEQSPQIRPKAQKVILKEEDSQKKEYLKQ